MSFKRMWAVFLRYFYVSTQLDQISDLFYWPAIDIFLWGMTSVWIQQHQAGVPNVLLIILTGLIFWHMIWRANYEVPVNLLMEFWNRNLVNLFSTPLKIVEWIGGLMMLGLFKICISLTFGSILVYFLYETNVFTVGWAFLPFALCLILSGWWIGFLSASIIVYWGQRFQMMAWMMAYVFSPFSAVFYPVDSLPAWGQTIAWCLPMTYTFEGMRSILTSGTFPEHYFWASLGLNLVYFLMTTSLFSFMFEKSRMKGLSRLE
ncbi:MAG: ABC transporter permease [Verrucomicrobia bacterium]|nr:ABC transporter permease [Verrucomicrobiota bacterium]